MLESSQMNVAPIRVDFSDSLWASLPLPLQSLCLWWVGVVSSLGWSRWLPCPRGSLSAHPQPQSGLAHSPAHSPAHRPYSSGCQASLWELASPLISWMGWFLKLATRWLPLVVGWWAGCWCSGNRHSVAPPSTGLAHIMVRSPPPSGASSTHTHAPPWRRARVTGWMQVRGRIYGVCNWGGADDIICLGGFQLSFSLDSTCNFVTVPCSSNLFFFAPPS